MYNFVEGGIHLAHTSPLHLHTLPVTFGLSAFVFSGHAVFPSIYRSMKDRSQYPRMLDTTYVIVGVTGALMGACLHVSSCYHSTVLVASCHILQHTPRMLDTTDIIVGVTGALMGKAHTFCCSDLETLHQKIQPKALH